MASITCATQPLSSSQSVPLQGHRALLRRGPNSQSEALAVQVPISVQSAAFTPVHARPTGVTYKQESQRRVVDCGTADDANGRLQQPLLGFGGGRSHDLRRPSSLPIVMSRSPVTNRQKNPPSCAAQLETLPSSRLQATTLPPLLG